MCSCNGNTVHGKFVQSAAVKVIYTFGKISSIPDTLTETESILQTVSEQTNISDIKDILLSYASLLSAKQQQTR